MKKTADQKRAEVIKTSNGTVLSNDVPQTTILAPKYPYSQALDNIPPNNV